MADNNTSTQQSSTHSLNTLWNTVRIRRYHSWCMGYVWQCFNLQIRSEGVGQPHAAREGT